MKYLLLALFLALGLNAKSQNYEDSVYLHGFLMDSIDNVCSFDTIKLQRLYILYNRSDQTDFVQIINLKDEIYAWLQKLDLDHRILFFEATEVIRFSNLLDPKFKND